MPDAISTLISDLEKSQYSAEPQNLIAPVADFVAALLEIQSGLAPTGPQNANTFYAGPASGAAAVPSFRAIVAADLPLATAAAFGAVKPDNTTITIAAGVITSTSGSVGANPTATAGPAAINGSATTFMRSDAAPAVQKASATQFGIVEVDGTTITASAGVISAVAPSLLASLTIGPTGASYVPTTGQCYTENLTTTQPGHYTGLEGDTVPRICSGLNSTDVAYIAMGPGGSGALDTFFERRSAANFRFGEPAAAAPVAQTLTVQNVLAGTSNTAGANLTIAGSQSTGNAAGGSILFQTSPLGSSGTAQNALVTTLTIAPALITAAVPIAAPQGTAAAPGVTVGNVNTGIYSTSSGANFGISVGGTLRFDYSISSSNAFTFGTGVVDITSNMQCITSGSWQLSGAAASSTQPTFIPNRSSTTTGIGAQASGNVSIIVGGTEVTRYTSAGILVQTGQIEALGGSAAAPGVTVANANTGIYSTSSGANFGISVGGNVELDYAITNASEWTFSASVVGSAAGSFQLADTTASGTVPTIIPYKGQTSGFGGASNGNVFVVIGGTQTATFSSTTFNCITGITLPGGTLLTTNGNLTNNAASSTATLTNAPTVGNPTKWIPINDNGTTRNIPAW